MKTSGLLPVWAPRIKPYLIRRLYESDARGIYDDELLNEVGWELYSRCESFIQAMQASQGKTRCPVCGAVVLHSLAAAEIQRCAACGWECPWRDYLKTIRNQQLNGGPEVVELFQNYVEQFPKADEPPKKMLLIDILIHGFHHYLSSGRTRRPVGVNLIDGDLQFVMEFLDRLTYGSRSTTGLEQNRQEWREHINTHSRQRSKKSGKTFKR